MTKRSTAARYARLMGSFWRHPRTVLLSTAAVGIHCRAISFCADNMTDGAIAAPMVAAFCGGAVDDSAVAELVDGGLWKRARIGYEIRDWTQHNITAESWAKQKDDLAARVAKSREKKRGGNASGNRGGNEDVTRYNERGNASETASSLDEGRRTKDEEWDPDAGEPRVEAGVDAGGPGPSHHDDGDRAITRAVGVYGRAIEASGGIFDGGTSWRDAFRSVERLARATAERDGSTVGVVLESWASRYVAERTKRRPDWWLEWCTTVAGQATARPSVVEETEEQLAERRAAARARRQGAV